MKNIVESILNTNTDKTNKDIDFLHKIADVTYDINHQIHIKSGYDVLGNKLNVGDYVIFSALNNGNYGGKRNNIGFGCITNVLTPYCEITIKKDIGISTRSEYVYDGKYGISYGAIIKVPKEFVEVLLKKFL